MATPLGYSPISSEARVRILALLAERPDRTIEELTEAVGLHPNTVREHVQRLVDLGFVLQHHEQRKTRGRPRLLFRLADGTADASSPIIRKKVREAAERGDVLRRVMPEIIPDGLSPQELHQLDAITEHLEETGFEPIFDEAALTVDLSPCAHLDDTENSPRRCGVHLSMIQSVLTEAGGPLSVGGMQASCNPRDCIIQILRRTDDT